MRPQQDFIAVGIAIRACGGERENQGGYGDDGDHRSVDSGCCRPERFAYSHSGQDCEIHRESSVRDCAAHCFAAAFYRTVENSDAPVDFHHLHYGRSRDFHCGCPCDREDRDYPYANLVYCEFPRA